LQLIDGKARLVSDLFCDGLGACIGHCPEGAIEIEEREAEPYDERRVMEHIIKQGPNVIKAHLEHMKEHNQTEYLQQAEEVLEEKGIANPLKTENAKKSANAPAHAHGGGCPGAISRKFESKRPEQDDESGSRPSRLTHWPVQLHLMSPRSPQYAGADVLLSADCVAYSVGDFHKEYLKDKALAIACPKLDQGKEVYMEKITSLVDEAKINTLTVMIMEVPCCSGLLQLAREAVSRAQRKVPVKCIVAGVNGEIQQEEWVTT
jgi:ferredoxin